MSSIDGVGGEFTAAVDSLAALDFDALDPPERFAVLELIETQQRRLTAISHAGIAKLEQFEGCPPVGIALADVVRISPREARREPRRRAVGAAHHIDRRTPAAGVAQDC